MVADPATLNTYAHMGILYIHCTYVAEQSSTNYIQVLSHNFTVQGEFVRMCDKICCMPGQGTKVLFVATSDHLPVIQQIDVRATDSCFDLIAPHQCGVLMVIVGWLAASVSTPSRTLVVSTEAGRGYQSLVWLYGTM